MCFCVKCMCLAHNFLHLFFGLGTFKHKKNLDRRIKSTILRFKIFDESTKNVV